MKRTALTCILACLFKVCAFAQGGSLTPPPGPPAPTMRSLQEIWDELQASRTQIANLQQQVAAMQVLQQQMFEAQYLTLGASFQLPWTGSIVAAGERVGAKPSMALSPSGEVWISYNELDVVDPLAHQTGTLKVARLIGSVWTAETVDTGIDARVGSSLAIGGNGFPWIAYSKGSQLRLARFNGSSWSSETVEYFLGPTYLSLAVGPDGNPWVAFSSVGADWLLVARKIGAGWDVTFLDNFVWSAPSIAISPQGLPVIAYQIGGGGLSLARFNGSVWTLQAPGVVGWMGLQPSAAFSSDGKLNIACNEHHEGETFLLRFLKEAAGGNWTKVTVDTVSAASDELDFTFDLSGQPLISYVDSATNRLRLARFNGVAWTSTEVTPMGNSGRESSLAIGPNGLPLIAYMHAPDGLKVVRQSLPTLTP